MLNLNLEGRIIILKTLVLSKIAYLVLLIIFPNCIIKESKRIQEYFIQKHYLLKIKPKTLRIDNKNGGLTNVDIFFRVASFQFSWGKRLYIESFHEWKIIALYFIENTFVFQFYSNFDFKNSILNYFSFYHHKVFVSWKSLFFGSPIVISCILNQ